MRKHFTKSLTVIFAVLGVYFVAFKVLMKVGVVRDYRSYLSHPFRQGYYREHRPRWACSRSVAEYMNISFSPLIWIERQVRGLDECYSFDSVPPPDWIAEYGPPYRDKP